MAGLSIGEGGCCCHYGIYYDQGYVLLFIDKWVLNAVGLKIPSGVSIQPGVGPRVWSFSEIGEVPQEMGRRNHPP